MPGAATGSRKELTLNGKSSSTKYSPTAKGKGSKHFDANGHFSSNLSRFSEARCLQERWGARTEASGNRSVQKASKPMGVSVGALSEGIMT